MSKKLFGITAAVKLVGCAGTTLRRYEELGIVKPIRDSENRRRFTQHDIDAAKRHINLRKTPQQKSAGS